MPHRGPILIIDDDIDDTYFLSSAIKELNTPNEIVSLTSGDEVMDYLRTVAKQPFIIFCDINMPRQNGLELKKEIDNDPVLRKKSIPFVFYSTSASDAFIKKAYYEMTIQGFFEKGFNSVEIQRTVKTILDYWGICKHPNGM